jgi:hypothetical protein
MVAAGSTAAASTGQDDPSLKSPLSIGRGAFLFPLTLALLLNLGCAGNPAKAPPHVAPLDIPASWGHPDAAIKRIPVKRPEPFDVAQPAELPVTVRGLRTADLDVVERIRAALRHETEETTNKALKTAVRRIARGGYPPAELMTGAIFIVPQLIADSVAQDAMRTVTQALVQIDLVVATRNALQARGVRARAQVDDTAQATLAVIAYGLVPKYGEVKDVKSELCLIVESALIVTAGGQELFRDAIHMTPYRRSADAPPPACRTLKEFAEDEGQSLKNAAHDHAQVLAVIAMQRLRELPWKP